MSYSSGETLLLTAIRAHANYDAINCVSANWKPLNKGKASTYAILRRGAETTVHWGSMIVHFDTHITVVEVWQRYKDDGTTQAALSAAVDNVFRQIIKYKRLADSTNTMQSCIPFRISEPLEMWNRGGNGPAWLRCDIHVRWVEEVTETFAD